MKQYLILWLLTITNIASAQIPEIWIRPTPNTSEINFNTVGRTFIPKEQFAQQKFADVNDALNFVNSVTPVIPNNVLPDDVNITIKSCKNISAKQALLIIPITKFFKKRHTLNKLISILKGESISLRLIDWFVTNYCKKYNIMYNLNLYRPHNLNETEIRLHNDAFDNFIIIHNNYKGQLKAYSKKNFDPFCRRNRIRFYYEDNKYFITTVGQLNFFKWALEYNIIDYIEKHLTIERDSLQLEDYISALNPDEFKEMVKMIRDVDNFPDPHSTEFNLTEREKIYRKSSKKVVLSAFDLIPGTIISDKDIVMLRTGEEYDNLLDIEEIIGKTVLVNIEKNKIIRKEFLK